MVGMRHVTDSEWVIAQRRDSGGYYPLFVVTGKREANNSSERLSHPAST